MGKLNRKIAKIFGYDLMRYKKSFRFEPTLDRLLANFSFDLAIDIGANAGWFSQKCLRMIENIKVISFEPADDLFQTLTKASFDEPRWQIVRAAVGDEAGQAILHIDTRDGVFNSLNAANPEFSEQYKQLKFKEDQTVDVVTLDGFFVEQGLNIHENVLLKIDTQGHDYKVLLGASLSLKRAKAVIVELPFQNIYDNTDSYKDILKLMDEAGFDIYSLSPISIDAMGRLIEVDCFFTRRN